MGTNITGIGNANAIGFKSRVTGGTYFPPELKDALVGVWSAYGKSNDSTDRNIIKNKIKDRGGDFVISNAAFKLNSGFGKYETEFSNTRIWTQSKETTSSPFSSNYNGLSGWIVFANTELTNSVDMPSFKIQVKGLLEGQELIYRYYDSTGQTNVYSMTKDGKYTLPADVRTAKPLTSNTSGFQIVKNETNIITITQIPSFEGAFVTDGINDLITSTKTVQEMLGGSNEITVVSMMANLDSREILCNSNFSNVNGYNVRNTLEPNGVISMLGYTDKNGTTNNLNLIMGDKDSIKLTDKVNFNSDYVFYPAQYYKSYYQVAWYWTFIANKVLTTDQINQVIAYFNLDRTLKPDILCNTIKQGITNENHAEFGDKLIDFSGNGRDIQLNNIAWKLDSGIGKYEVDFSTWSGSGIVIGNGVGFKIEKETISWWEMYAYGDTSGLGSFTIKVTNCHDPFVYRYKDEDGNWKNYLIESDGIYTLPASGAKDDKDNYRFFNSNPNATYNGLTVEQIPSHAGALCLDGINDFGKVTGMPIYKDYTVVADYERTDIGNIEGIGTSPVLSKSYTAGQGSFIMNFIASTGNWSHSYSFGTENTSNFNDLARQIFYQSKYKNQGFDITAGTGVDGDSLWLGTARDNDSRFFNGAIYSLMSFPYSMSEFLIERQLKKYKLGTLYPDMVEFRPVIKSNVLLDAKPTFVIRGTSTYLNAGDYVPENSQIWVSIKMNNIADRITKFTVNGKTIDIPENAYSEVTLQYGFPFVIDKSPQKISITIEQDENYVLFNPVINSNYDNYKLTFHLREYEKLINIGDYIPKGTYIRANLYLKNDIDELVTFTFNGVNIDYAKSPVLDTAYNIRQIYNYDSPQEVNITIDEYIRYEDIVQPYPVLLRFNDENGNEVSWGGKFKVGSTITRIGSIADPERNLLNGLYSISGLSLNGKTVTSSTSIVEKQMVFRTTATWLLDDNEPKVILSPSRLRIPNSSYKILGYIPDISGHGNHGKINNSAYAGASGANGYLQNFSGWTKASGVSSTDSVISSSNNLVAANGWIAYVTSGTVVPTFKVEISGIPINGNLRFEGSGQTLVNGVNTIQGLTTTKISGFYISSGYDNDWSNLRIEQVGEYEGAYCLDGVDDFVTIPTVTGGKQVLMKVNWQSDVGAVTLYDQRLNMSDYEFAIYNGTRDLDDNPVMAYQGRNNGQTYIDGILNSNIMASELKAITHNITITNELSLGINNTYPVIGSTRSNTHFAQMSLYDFMLFDEISTDDKIKELNEYVGIEAKVELPPYYWDAYGKTNLDADKATIQQRGVAVGDYDITNYNHAYEGMSGYNGYPVVFGANKTWANESNGYVTSITSNTIHITNVLNAGLALLYSYVKYNGNLQNIKEIPSFKIEIKGLEGKSKFIYKYLATSDATKETNLYLGNGTHELPKSFLPTEALINNAVVGFSISPIEEGVTKFLSDITIEVLPEYSNGLVYDGITDYSKNANIPALDDFTAIIKREWLKKQGSPLIKGSKVYEGGNGNALLLEWDKAYNFVFYKRTDIMEGELPDNISFITPTNYNGNVITRGSEQDTNGICIAGDGNAGFANMVFYKLILYPKTIPLLQINFLKNLMEKDEIIDLNNPIFIKNE